MDVKLNLSDGQLKDLMGEAILRALDTQTREALLGAALKHLVTVPDTDRRFGVPQESPLQRAFNSAVYDLARQVVTAELSTNPTMTAQIHALYAEACDRLFTRNREQVIDRIADALRAGLVLDK